MNYDLDMTVFSDEEIELITLMANESATRISQHLKVRGIDLDLVFGDETHGDLVTLVFEEIAVAMKPECKL